MIRHSIQGSGGLNLTVHEHGNPKGAPILFLHGLSSSSLAWSDLFDGELSADCRLLFLDARGHGMSDKPLDPAAYTTSDAWADDVQAVISTLELTDTILVGWSYGGFVINDFLARHGDSQLGAVAYISAGVLLGNEKAANAFGESFVGAVPGLCSDDLEVTISTMVPFLRSMSASEFPPDQLLRWMGFHMSVPWQVRLGMISRSIDQDAAMQKTKVPALVVHGEQDRLIHISHAKHIEAQLEQVHLSLYEGVGHAPPMESPRRLEQDLAALAQRVARKS